MSLDVVLNTCSLQSRRRSKRLLISGQIMMLIVYAISAGLIAAMLAKPIQLDLKVNIQYFFTILSLLMLSTLPC